MTVTDDRKFMESTSLWIRSERYAAIIWQPAPAARSCETDIAIACAIGIDTGKNTLHMIGLDEKGIQARSPSRRAGTHQLVDLERTNGPSPEKPCHHRSSRPTS